MIYQTPYDSETNLCTGSSVDSGFTSFDEAIMLYGVEPVERTDRHVKLVFDGGALYFSVYRVCVG